MNTQTQTTEVNEFQKQANDFLVATNTEFSVKYLRTGKYFDDDKEERDIYEITLKRGQRTFTFSFGQSIANSGFYYTKGVQKFPLDRTLLNKPQLATYIIRKDYGFLNNGKSDKIHYPKTPTAYDVLACLQKYEVGTFENFCNEFGYDTDSRKAEKIYKAVVNEWQNVAMLFTDSEIEQLQEIQ